MTEANVEAARRIALDAIYPRNEAACRAVAGDIPAWIFEGCGKIATALSRAGLLRDDLDREARAACAELHRGWCDGLPATMDARTCREVGRRILAQDKPEPRWSVVEMDDPDELVRRWAVRKSGSVGSHAINLTESEAAEVCVVLNRLAEREAK